MLISFSFLVLTNSAGGSCKHTPKTWYKTIVQSLGLQSGNLAAFSLKLVLKKNNKQRNPPLTQTKQFYVTTGASFVLTHRKEKK